MKTHQQLALLLNELDRQSYPAYKRIKGEYTFTKFNLIIDRVQGDPFAAPSNIKIRIPHAIAQFPSSVYQSPLRCIALADYLHRQIAQQAHHLSNHRGSGKSGEITLTEGATMSIAPIGQEVLARTSVLINSDYLEVRLMVGLPAQGRRILGHQAKDLLCEDIPKIVNKCLLFSNLNYQQIQNHLETIEDAEYIRQQLPAQDLIAFVANGAILPRQSGVSSLPLSVSEVVKFQSPPNLEVEFNCPNRGKIRGMGIKKGITLIVGGGYHGKSTLLHALELGIYNHIPDDGREFVVTNPHAVKIRAEEGRSIVGVDISPFINHLPQGKSTVNFSTPNASGSTSQSANIIEVLEVGAKVLLIDEDTSATNFMIRDARMQRLIAKEKEPITPFVDKIKALKDDYDVSTILVMGGSGDYFEVADCVIAMDCFQPQDVTKEAQKIAEEFTQQRITESDDRFGNITSRMINPRSIDASKGKKSIKLQVRGVDIVQFGKENIDLSACQQFVESSQLKAIAHAIVLAKEKYLSKNLPLKQTLQLLMADIQHQGLDILTPTAQPDLADFRLIDLAIVINRLRSLKLYNRK
jgi:predicted ABC-class ATPase